MSAHAELIARLEAATGPDRELDELVARDVVGMPATITLGHEVLGNLRTVPRYCPPYTASVDAALALLERVLPGVWFLMGRGKTRADEPLYGIQLLFGTDEVLCDAEHDHLAIAIAIAAVRGLALRSGKQAA